MNLKESFARAAAKFAIAGAVLTAGGNAMAADKSHAPAARDTKTDSTFVVKQTGATEAGTPVYKAKATSIESQQTLPDGSTMIVLKAKKADMDDAMKQAQEMEAAKPKPAPASPRTPRT